MEGSLAVLLGGLVLGLASTVHCACMCGGIASGALFLIDPGRTGQRTIVLLLLQAGRITTYATAGAVIAGVAGLMVQPQATEVSFRVLQWAGALALMWMGLATAGMLPRLALPAGMVTSATRPLSAFLDPILSRLRHHPRVSAYVLGLSWGLTPCPMVWAALISAPLAGSAALGGLWMVGFGLGTLPGVLSAALGVSWLSRLRGGQTAEVAAGLAIAAFGFVTLYFGWPASGILCLTR